MRDRGLVVSLRRIGDVLLTTPNPAVEMDRRLFAELGLELQAAPNA